MKWPLPIFISSLEPYSCVSLIDPDPNLFSGCNAISALRNTIPETQAMAESAWDFAIKGVGICWPMPPTRGDRNKYM